MTLEKIAQTINGRLTGSKTTRIYRISTPEKAARGDIAVIFNLRSSKVLNCRASALVAPFASTFRWKGAIIEVQNPRLALAGLLELFHPPSPNSTRHHPTAVVDPTAQVGRRTGIGPHTVVGTHVQIGNDSVLHAGVIVGDHARIGHHVVLYPHVVVYSGIVIGNHVTIHSGSVIGSDGYGYVMEDNRFTKIPQVGRVVIGDHVEIGSNVSVDRGTLDDTVIGEGCIIDNLVQIGHNCRIGKHCAIIAQTGLSGSTVLEDHVGIGGQAGTAGHLTIGHHTIVKARSGVTKDIPPHSTISGFPAINHLKDKTILAHQRRLPELVKTLRTLPKRRGRRHPTKT